jgi:hypothetical protein
MRLIRHYKISDQAGEINVVLRGHYAYYGVAGNLRSLVKVYRAVERYWRRMLRSRSWAGRHLTWDAFNQIKERTPLLKPKLRLPYRELQALCSDVNQLSKSVGAGNPHATFCGIRRRATASGDPVDGKRGIGHRPQATARPSSTTELDV